MSLTVDNIGSRISGHPINGYNSDHLFSTFRISVCQIGITNRADFPIATINNISLAMLVDDSYYPTTYFKQAGVYNMSESQVFMFDNSDPEMQRAYEQARSTFRYFWREIVWDRQRIVPALGLAAIKAPFTDGKTPKRNSNAPQVEHMWLSDVDFDGEFVSGVLVNSPNWLKSIKQGDNARIRITQLSDWMYAMSGKVYGAYTVNLMRSRMSVKERREHDNAWGMDFGDPLKIRIDEKENHTMSENMASSLKDHMAKTPTLAMETGHNGWTLLHQQASAGSIATLKLLLDAGADPNATADNGMTPIQLARSLGWESVVDLLASR